MKLLPCPFCGGEPTLNDHRLVWSVQCKCTAFVMGDRAPEPQSKDHEKAIDWDHYRKTAIDKWNCRRCNEVER